MVSLCLIFVGLIICVLACFSLSLTCMGLSVLLGLDWPFPLLGMFLATVSSKIFSDRFFSSFSGTTVIRRLVCLIFYQRSLRLSLVLFVLFPLFCSSLISTILSSSSLIHSSTSIILLIPCRVFLISVIVLFNLCLFLLYFF